MNPHPLPDLKVWGQLKFAPLLQKVGHTLVRSQEEINCLCPLVLCIWFHCKTSFSGSGTRGWNRNMWQAWSSYKTVNDRHFLNLLITLLATMRLSFQVSCPPLLLFSNRTCFPFSYSSSHNLCWQNLEVTPSPAVKKLHIYLKDEIWA